MCPRSGRLFVLECIQAGERTAIRQAGIQQASTEATQAVPESSEQHSAEESNHPKAQLLVPECTASRRHWTAYGRIASRSCDEQYSSQEQMQPAPCRTRRTKSTQFGTKRPPFLFRGCKVAKFGGAL